MIWHVTLHFSEAGMENQGFRGLSLLPPDEAPLPLARKRKRPLAMPAAGSVDAERRPQARASGSAGILRPERRVLREQGSGPRPEHRVLREQKDRLGMVWPGSRFVCPASARLGHVRPGPVGLDAVRLGSARFGSARLRSVPFGSSSIRPGSAWLHSVRPGLVRFPSVRLIPAWFHSVCLGVLGWSAVCGHFRSIGCRSAGVGQGSKKGELISTFTWPARCQRHPTTYLIRNV
jgi:hypothetical protein